MTRTKISWILYAGMMLVLLAAVSSVPVPYGIDGVVYGLDGERADSSVKIAIRNLNNSYYVHGFLREDGSYSASLQGEPGNSIEVTASTGINTVRKVFIIEEVMHGHNLSLNLSKPEPVKPDLPQSSSSGSRKRILRRPRVVAGLITLDDEPAAPGIEYELTNTETGETVGGEVQEGLNAYADVIRGNEGDLLELQVGDDSYNERTAFPITGEVTRKDVNLNISNLEFRFIRLKNRYGAYVLGGVVFIFVALIIGYMTKKK